MKTAVSGAKSPNDLGPSHVDDGDGIVFWEGDPRNSRKGCLAG
jgi:hypothetical protein